MDSVRELTKALVTDSFNRCVAAGVANSEIDAIIDNLVTLIMGDSTAPLIDYADQMAERLEAERAALPLKKIEAETAYDAAIAAAVDAKTELETP